MENNAPETANPEAGRKKISTGTRVRKILSIVLDVILYLFLVLCVFFLIFSLVSKKNDGATNLFGYEMRIVISDSMEKSENSAEVGEYKIKNIPLRSMVFVKRAPDHYDEESMKEWCSALQVGDVLTFRYVLGGSQITITHRIIEITSTENGYILKLQGDNYKTADKLMVGTQTIYTSQDDCPTNSKNDFNFNYIIGKVVGQSVAFGYIVYAISQPLGLALIVIVPCAIIIVWQIIRVAAVLTEDRRKKAAEKVAEAERIAAAANEEQEKQARELEELKRKFAELERRQSDRNGDDVG